MVSEADWEENVSPQQQGTQHRTATTTDTTTSTTTTNTGRIVDMTFSRHPQVMRQCPNCQQESRTRIETFPTMGSWIAALVLLLVFWPVCWIPLVIDNCKRTNHHCVSCGEQVGTVDPFTDCCVKRRG